MSGAADPQRDEQDLGAREQQGEQPEGQLGALAVAGEFADHEYEQQGRGPGECRGEDGDAALRPGRLSAVTGRRGYVGASRRRPNSC